LATAIWRLASTLSDVRRSTSQNQKNLEYPATRRAGLTKTRRTGFTDDKALFPPARVARRTAATGWIGRMILSAVDFEPVAAAPWRRTCSPCHCVKAARPLCHLERMVLPRILGMSKIARLGLLSFRRSVCDLSHGYSA